MLFRSCRTVPVSGAAFFNRGIFPVFPGTARSTGAFWLFLQPCMFSDYQLFMNFILGLLSMITMNIKNINWGYNAVLRFFSGQMVPLWIFPGILGTVSGILPFRCIYAIPMSIYIGNDAGVDMLRVLGVQFVWILLLWVFSRLLMKRVFARVMIQGG